MKVLMISIDRGLLGQGQLGDVVERHKKYGQHVKRLDIIVLSGTEYQENKISETVTVYPTRSANKLLMVKDAYALGAKLFKQNHYDLIVTQEPFFTGLVGYFLKKKFGAKLLIHFHGDFWENPKWLKESKRHFLYLLLSKYVVGKADAIRVVSQGIKEKLIKAGIATNKISVIATPVDLGKYNNRQSLIANHQSRMILHVGRDDKVKDYDTLVKAFKIVKKSFPAAVFVQAGAYKVIKQAMSMHDSNITELKGLVSADDLIKLYHSSSVVVLSSTSESFGKVLVEANACAKPVVSTATTGAQEIIQDGVNGFLVPIGDAKTLAEKIIYLLKHSDEAKLMGEAGRKMVQEKYGNNLGKVIRLWQSLIS